MLTCVIGDKFLRKNVSFRVIIQRTWIFAMSNRYQTKMHIRTIFIEGPDAHKQFEKFPTYRIYGVQNISWKSLNSPFIPYFISTCQICH